MNHRRLLALTFCVPFSVAAAPRVLTLFNAQWTGGGSRGDNSHNFGTNVDIQWMPVVEWSPGFSLLPVFHSSYQGNRQATRSSDDRLLFQQEQNHSVELKALHKLTESWRLSWGGGAQWNYLRETSDESWSEGLYDHTMAYATTGFEKRFLNSRWPSSIRLALDASQVRYPHYTSVVSVIGLSNIGNKPLNTDNFQSVLKLDGALGPRVYSVIQIGSSLAHYTDQRKILNSGLPGTDKRQDIATFAKWRLEWTLAKRNLWGKPFVSRWALETEGKKLLSNQSLLKGGVVHPDYYDYWEGSLTPSYQARWGKNACRFTVGIRSFSRHYAHRLAQNIDGTDQNKKLVITTLSPFAQLTLPIRNHWSWFASLDRVKGRSNTNDESIYRYRYTNTAYQMGLSYEF